MKIIVLFGGKSVEHEISIISAFQVIEVLKTRYQVIPVYISKNNEFFYNKKMTSIDYFKSEKNKCSKYDKVRFIKKDSKYYIKGKKKSEFDLIFPIVHGKGSEDGSLLSYFKFQGFPIVGNSACFYGVAQNKYLTKKILDGLEIENVKGKLVLRDDNYKKEDFNFPCIVKPNNLGSSLGISVVNNFVDLQRALSLIFRIDSEALVEEYLCDCKEYNLSVLNNDGKIECSNVEEIIKGELFTFEDKYLNGNKDKGMAKSRVTKKQVVSKELRKKLENVGRQIYRCFGASGVIRIDFLYKDKLYVNEINSIPGSYAYYLWEDKYDFLELVEMAIKEAKRNIYFENKNNELIDRSLIFKI